MSVWTASFAFEFGLRHHSLNSTGGFFIISSPFPTYPILPSIAGGLDSSFMRRYRGVLSVCTPRSFDPRLRKYCRYAGMKVIKSPHDVRRTVLTNLYMLGMPLKNIQEYAGHSSLKQTMDYIRITDDDLDMMQYKVLCIYI